MDNWSKISLDSSGWLRGILIILLLGTQLASLAGLTPIVQASTVTFGNPINLSNDPTSSGLPVIATSGKYVYVAWLNNSCIGCKSDVLFKASSNNGTSFGPSTKLSSTTNGDASSPQVAAAGNNVYVVWQDNATSAGFDVFLRKSIDNGATFSTQIDLSTGVNNAVDSEYPQVSAAGNNVTVAWWLVTTSHNTPHNIVAKTSINSGTFGSALSLSTNANPSLSPDSGPKTFEVGKYVYITWRDGNSKIFFTASKDGGQTFSFVAPLNISGTVTGDSDLYPAIAAAGNNVYVTWTNDSSACPITCSNTMFRASTNNGASFGSIMNLYTNNQITDLNPEIAASGNSVYVVWTNSTGAIPQILFRGSTNQGSSFNSIKNLSPVPLSSNQQVIAAVGTNVYVVWVESNSSNEVFLASSRDSGSTFGSAQDLSPTVGNGLSPMPAIGASGPNVYVAWQDDLQGAGDILFRGNGSPPTFPDVAITALNVSRTFAYSGANANNVTVSVTISNLGSGTATTFTVGVNASRIIPIGNLQTVSSLAPGLSQVLVYNWKTASLAVGKYNVTAFASSAPGETNLSNNVLVCPPASSGCLWSGFFVSRLKGDVNADCHVDIVDLATVGNAFGKSIGQSGYNAAADINNDGTINIVDLVLVSGPFGQQISPCPY